MALYALQRLIGAFVVFLILCFVLAWVHWVLWHRVIWWV